MPQHHTNLFTCEEGICALVTGEQCIVHSFFIPRIGSVTHWQRSPLTRPFLQSIPANTRFASYCGGSIVEPEECDALVGKYDSSFDADGGVYLWGCVQSRKCLNRCKATSMPVT